jgi:hypothetical protein
MAAPCETTFQITVDPLGGGYGSFPIGPITCTVGPLGAGEAMTFDVPVPNGGIGLYTIRVDTATGRVSGAPGVDRHAGNNSATARVHVRRSQADLEVVQVTGPAVLAGGQGGDYQAVIRNNGPNEADFTNYISTDANVASTCISSCGVTRLAPGASFTETFRVVAPGTVTQMRVNVSVGSSTSDDPNPSNNSRHITTQIQPSTDLRVTIDAASDILPGTTTPIRIDVANVSDTAAADVRVRIDITQLTIVQRPGACSESGNVLDCRYAGVAARATTSIQLMARPVFDIGIATVHASATTASLELDLTNNVADDLIVIDSGPVYINLHVSSTVLATPDQVAVTFTIENRGTITATSVTFSVNANSDDPAAGQSPLEWTTAPWQCSPLNAIDVALGTTLRLYRCTSAIPAGQSRQFEFVARRPSARTAGGWIRVEIDQATVNGHGTGLRGTRSDFVEIPAVPIVRRSRD